MMKWKKDIIHNFQIIMVSLNFNKDLNELRKYYDLWYQQNNKITDKAKADRRINAFYNFFLSQEPNISSSYKSEFNRIKAKFENSMEHLNLYEAVNSKIIFNEILNND